MTVGELGKMLLKLKDQNMPVLLSKDCDMNEVVPADKILGFGRFGAFYDEISCVILPERKIELMCSMGVLS